MYQTDTLSPEICTMGGGKWGCARRKSLPSDPAWPLPARRAPHPWHSQCLGASGCKAPARGDPQHALHLRAHPGVLEWTNRARLAWQKSWSSTMCIRR